MNTAFEELNLRLYYAAYGACLDAVIWCLGPAVDDSREYGVFRIYLAAITRRACRSFLRVTEK